MVLGWPLRLSRIGRMPFSRNSNVRPLTGETQWVKSSPMGLPVFSDKSLKRRPIPDDVREEKSSLRSRGRGSVGPRYTRDIGSHAFTDKTKHSVGTGGVQFVSQQSTLPQPHSIRINGSNFCELSKLWAKKV